MDIRRLRNFVAVAETENMSRAANRAHLSQPALSRQVQGLEEDLQITLFERAGRKVRLTGAGRDLLAHARRVLSEADAFVDRARALRRGDEGVLRVGAPPQVLERILPPTLKRFGARMPGVNVHLREGRPSALQEWLLKGELDLAFMRFRPELRESSLPAGAYHVMAVADRARLGPHKSIDVRALEAAPVLVLAPGFGSRDLLDAACEVGQVRLNVVLESAAPATLMALARAGYGVAVLPSTVALPRARFAIYRLEQNGKPLGSDAAVHWDPRRHLPAFGFRFAEELAMQGRAQYGSRG